jgi:hypothetical protein
MPTGQPTALEFLIMCADFAVEQQSVRDAHVSAIDADQVATLSVVPWEALEYITIEIPGLVPDA